MMSIARLIEPYMHIIGKLPLTEFRRRAKIIYSQETDLCVEYALAKGLIIGGAFIVILIIYGLSSDPAITPLIIMGCACLPLGVYIEFKDLEKEILSRKRAIGIQFSRFASNCVLFITSGLSVKHAFIKSAHCLGEGPIKNYIDMAVLDLQMNMNTAEVFGTLNMKLLHPVVAEFTSILQQYEKYGSESKADLKRVIYSAWQSRKDAANIAAKEMETKLVFPSMLIFAGVMLMLLVALVMQLTTL